MGIGKIARRTFLGIGAVAAGGVAVGYYYYRKPYDNPLEEGLAAGEATFNPYVKIAEDDTITIIAPRAEMGQGIQTTLAALVAEELDVDLHAVRVEHGPSSPAYYNDAMLAEGAPFPWFDEGFMPELMRSGMAVASKFLGLQVTGGSSATIDAFTKMREAGCAARHLLTAAAAERWGVDAATLETASGQVTNPATGESLSYGAFASAAATQELPSDMQLRDRSEWKILGKSPGRVEIAEKVTGGRIFGIDVELPEMLHGTVVISPRFGARAASVSTEAALAVPGVRAVEPIETSTGAGFGIIADHTWAAFQGAEALDVFWEEATYPADDAAITAALEAAFDGDPASKMMDAGDVETALADAPAGEVVEAEYAVPYLAHACLEPMNATAQVADGKATIWTGTQAPGIVQMAVGSLLGIESEDVTVHTTHLGGGFGRRGEVDYPLYAAALAAKTGGRPIKVTWTREEDTRHDVYRPAARARMRAHVVPGEGIQALDMHLASPSIIASVTGRTFPGMGTFGPDKSVVDGAFNQPYTIPNWRVAGYEADIPIPVGFWRSVGNSQNGYFHEAFVDEMAEAAGADPLAFRLAHMGDPRMAPARGVLAKAAEMAGWGREMPAGRGLGIAHVLSFGTWVAEVVEVDATGGEIRIPNVWCAADPGEVLDPDNFRAQMVSGIVFGLSSALGQEITFEEGEVQQWNFWDFDAMRMAQCPTMHVELLENSPRMGGAGEPSMPPSVPALANAIYAATGKRLRRMPFSHEVQFYA
ncbi:MAG: molybdopterin cofactor-binding domain-containing protein [Pseudomonadota bacterium]